MSTAVLSAMNLLRPPRTVVDDAAGPADARMAALRARDPEVLAEVVKELLPSVRAWLHRLLGPGADLDDAMQDALTEIACSLHRYEGRASLRTLAHRITLRRAYRYFGRHKREQPLSVVTPPAYELDPESLAMEREALRRLYRCLDRLPDKRRVAFVLCAVEGISPQDAALLEGVSSATMRSRLKHARREVARRLSSDPYIATLIGAGDWQDCEGGAS